MVPPHAPSCMSCQGRKFGKFDQLFTGYPASFRVGSIQPFVGKSEACDGNWPLFGPDRQRYDRSLSGWQFITCDIHQDSCHFPEYLGSRRKFRSLIVPDRAVTIVKVKKISGHLLPPSEYFTMKCRLSNLFPFSTPLEYNLFSVAGSKRGSRS